MKKVLVLSDSHRNKAALYKILKIEKDADELIFLGDGIEDIEDCLAEIIGMTDGTALMVKGNCDPDTMKPADRILEICGNKIFCTHGNNYHVEHGIEKLAEKANETGCGMVLYGHTHLPAYHEISGLKLFNPGAVVAGEYGVITFMDNGCVEFLHRTV